RRVGPLAPAEADRGLRLDEGGRRGRLSHTKRLDVVENPEAAAVSRDDDVIAMDDEIANRRGRHVLAERHPMLSIVARHPDLGLAAGEEESFRLRIFADDVDRRAAADAVRDLAPRAAAVARAENVRAQVVEADRVDC